MGCVSSNLLNQEDDFTQIGHHIYGLLTTLDPSSSPTTVAPTPPPRFTLAGIPNPNPNPKPEAVVNSWELTAGLDPTADGHPFTPQPSKLSQFRYPLLDKENLNSNPNSNNLKNPNLARPVLLNGFEPICPPNGEKKVVVYTTSLRGVRRTFEGCNAVRAVLEGFGVVFSERDISMDRGFRDELWELMKGKDKEELVPPRVFVKGRYVGGVDEVLKIVEEGYFGHLLEDLPKVKPGFVCEVCGGARFLPCLTCNGSCKMVMVVKEVDGEELGKDVIVKCVDCNENGLVRCSICC